MADDYGRRLLPSCLRREAARSPQRLFAIVAKSNNVEDGSHFVTFQQVATAVNFTSHWLLDRFSHGTQPSGHPTIGYVGASDLRYNILFYAAIQCRYKVFLPSPRNPVVDNVSLLQQTDCSSLVYTAEVAPVAKGLKLALEALRCEQLPSLEELLSCPDMSHAYDLQFADVSQEPVLILHSSGSTGLPKPVTYTHGTIATLDFSDFPTVLGRTNHDLMGMLRSLNLGARVYDAFPLYHLAGFILKVMVPVCALTVPIFGPSNRPPSGALAAQIMRLYNPRCAILPPSIVGQIFHQADSVQLLKTLDILLYAGGPLPTIVGDELSKHTTLCQFFGSTEFGQIRQLIPLPEDWAYVEFHPNESFELRDVGNGLFELVLITNKDLERTSFLYHNYPDIPKWHTKDLFEPHPSKKGLWKFHARNDDILVFSSGEKVNPIPMEMALTSASNVSGALMVGQGHPQPALLVELSADADEVNMQQNLWPAINAANALLPGHARISRNMVIIANPERPFQRAGKGTIIRALTEKLYATEIEQLYSSSPVVPKAPAVILRPSMYRIEDIKAMIRSILEKVSIPQGLADEENLYSHGMDSVKTAEALSYLRDTLLPLKPEQEWAWLSLETLYLNPTINHLSAILLSFLNEDKKPSKRDRVAEMQRKIDEYIARLPQFKVVDTNTPKDKYNVVVTGTTGFLGGQLLKKLCHNPRVGRIYCLNRSSTARQSSERLGIPLSDNVTFLQVNFASSRLGLGDQDYKKLLENCDIIVHNAWRVDFNLSLGSFEDNLDSVSHLIELSASSLLYPRVIFISSIGATGVWAAKGGVQQTIPEGIVDDLSTTMQTGYAESKRVAEHVLSAAASQAGVPVTVVRLGQISPGDDTAWPEKDIVPVFLRSCKSSGLLASDFVERIDWVPIDQAAAIIDDMVVHELEERPECSLRVYNLVNPYEHQWISILPILQSWCGPKTQVTNMEQWIEEVRKTDTSDATKLGTLPALRMLHIYEMFAGLGPLHRYAMQNLMAVNGSVRKLTKLDERQLRSWLQQV